MKLISLNIWRGKLLNKLKGFIKQVADSTDIFCFQEVVNVAGVSTEKNDLFSAMVKLLPDFQGFFESCQDEGRGTEKGLAMFIKKTEKIEEEGDFFVYRTRNAMTVKGGETLGKNIQYVQINKSGKRYTIINFHGLWMKEGRGDTKERIGQAQKLKDFLNTMGGAKIICGDFNLTLNTKSMAIIDENMRNLIREYGINSTRNRFFPYADKFCDYIIVDKNVRVNDFRVLKDEISDHLALFLDFG
jgi:endonuclease/exonuclease/phosphatase family metal-dependent hydrolase